MTQLSPRLAALAARIQAGPVADIGCDHGLLSCALALDGHEVYAVDISDKAL
nr:SAM-dependent methyltransferase [bacterium]